LYSKFVIGCTEKPIWNLSHVAVIKFLARSHNRRIKIDSTADTVFDKRMVDLYRTLVVHWSKHWQTQLPQLWTEYKKLFVTHVWSFKIFSTHGSILSPLLWVQYIFCFYQYYIAYSTEKFFYDHLKIYNLEILKIIFKTKYMCMLFVIMHTADARYLKIKKIRL